LRLTDNCWFDCRWDGKALEVHAFNDSNVNTYYDLSGAPKEKIEAIKTLNLRNKLNEHTALELARTYFRLQGHKEENFWPVEFTQCYWIDQTERKPEERVLPFYRAEWFRKDIRKEDRESGVAALPHVNIELSGITSNLVLYEKLFIPIARDF
jgi:hypothetical protein